MYHLYTYGKKATYLIVSICKILIQFLNIKYQAGGAWAEANFKWANTKNMHAKYREI